MAFLWVALCLMITWTIMVWLSEHPAVLVYLLSLAGIVLWGLWYIAYHDPVFVH